MSAREEQEIGKAVDAYLNSIKTGEKRYFERAFYPDSVVINAGEGDPERSTRPIDVFAEDVRSRHEMGVRCEEIPLGMTISHVGNAANVRLDFELIIGDRTLYGTDYFNMVKRDGRWRISQKIFDVTHTK
ncbi:hypothetical protein AC482_05540 [miscellaneous Crenarchaeota group-15 archaeon DG-45]|uniref:SnoaL-like domain-containing protein n=1 Tax=miscellaneous Crenarchaeota group-15 archaeon DG-45 TaxID=1685127 RepID=A0A0M0BMH0_9ARCH|nr:MAG: hypothetical protein AC482_05540 [miscellaneous Crenarchaeota group-15 archaeon DG-45]